MYYVKPMECGHVDNVGGFWEYLGRILAEITRFEVV